MNYDYKNLKPIFINGYIEYYIPNHHRASKNGCVYEHILVAENMLNRELYPEEVVHHKDKVKSNNTFENLMFFATKADHTAYHNGAKIYLTNLGNYRSKKNVCAICNKEISNKAKLCKECSNKEKSKHIPSKEELSKLIINNTNIAISKIYNCSDRTVGKWRKRYSL